MQKSNNKKNVKLIAMVIVAFFAIGIVGMAVTQTQVGLAAPAESNSAIGFVDKQRLVMSHPDIKTIGETLKAETVAAQKEFEEKAKDLAPQEQQRYFAQLDQRIKNKEMELMKPLIDKIDAAVKTVAEAKGLTVVVDSMVVVFGGTDITDDVIKSYGGNAGGKKK